MSKSEQTTNVGLSLEGCRQRLTRLQEQLASENLDAALLTDPRHIYYFTGYWRGGRVLTPAALLVRADGRNLLITPSLCEDQLAVENVQGYEADRIATLIDDPYTALLQALQPSLKGIRTLGREETLPLWPLPVTEQCSLSAILFSMRRTKALDEVEMLRVGIRGCDAAYARAREMLAEGITEVELYAEMLGAATKALGEPLTAFGNDFQCGALGSLPRNRRVQTGETAIFDVGVVYRGYSSDLCRTFVVGGTPTDAQIIAHRRVLEALEYVEAAVRPGVRCRDVYDTVHAMLDGFRGWRFPHHLGHGIGLSAHEAPRLNPHWDDTFEVGDVFTAEPGLYGEALRVGLRIEQDYLVTETGVQRLSHFPTDLY
jgi:Xaa-Pro dipeptidase